MAPRLVWTGPASGRMPAPCWAGDGGWGMGSGLRWASPGSGAFDRLQRTVAVGRLDRVAGALGDVFPGIALVIDRRGSGAGRARTGGAIVVALERDAEAFVLGRLRRFWCSRARTRHNGERRRQGTGQRQRRHGSPGRHSSIPLLVARNARRRERRPIKTENRRLGNIICPMDSIARLYDARTNRRPAPTHTPLALGRRK